MSKNPKDQLIVALDVETFEEARELAALLAPSVDIFKIGSQLFTACGPVVVRYLMAMGKKVFLDLKFHDIPNTVANAVNAAVSIHSDVLGDNQNPSGKTNQGLLMYTVHTMGGKAMLEAAANAGLKQAKALGIKKPLALGITVLTSEEKNDNIPALVLERALLARESGLDGVVASSQEAKSIRQKLGKDFIIVTPGIRPKESDTHDQQRIATPFEAIKNGSDYLVVGRPIVKAPQPQEVVQKILEEIKQAQV